MQHLKDAYIFHNSNYANFSITLLLGKTSTIFSKNKRISYSFQNPYAIKKLSKLLKVMFKPGLGLNALSVSLHSPNKKKWGWWECIRETNTLTYTDDGYDQAGRCVRTQGFYKLQCAGLEVFLLVFLL